MKKEIRVIGIDDSPFEKHTKKNILVIGAVFRGGSWLDGVLSTKIMVDGSNSTYKLSSMINKCKYKPQLQCILLDGIALGGFNVIDVKELNKRTKIPVIVVIRRYPDFKKIENVLKKLGKGDKFKLIKKAGKVRKVNNIFIQINGITLEDAEEILKITCTRSYIPEPIRVAHIIAAGVYYGESKGKA